MDPTSQSPSEPAERADAFLRLIHRAKRGKLKVYLGYGPGVGKTYRMLQEAHALRQQGVDVVVGYVEDHPRPETQALVEGLAVVPRRATEYRGVRLEEMDLDAVLARMPTVALVDELAHTNVPGSPHRKRYEDVMRLLDAGVHVISTLNVQHLESLYDTVERLTGVKVKERIPDWVLAEADQVVNVDLSVEDLRVRMESGKVYPEERARAALANFFVPANLEHLRNLTLRETAAHIEERGRTDGGEERVVAPEQVVVCLSSRGPDSAALLRFGSRLAGRLNLSWYALYVETPRERPEEIDATTQRLLSETLALAQTLGATVYTFRGAGVAETILRFAAEYGAGHIVIGRSAPLPWWKRLLGRRTVVERLLARARGQAVVVVDARRPQSPDAPSTAQSPRAQAPRAQARGVESPPAPLTAILVEEGVVVWEAPVTKEEAVRTLLERAARRSPEVQPDEALRRLWQREALGSTFVGEGIAIPHARIDGLAGPILALGLTHGGVVGADETEVVWLLLLPTEGSGLGPTAQVARASRDPVFRQALREAGGPSDALDALYRWEQTHERPLAR